MFQFPTNGKVLLNQRVLWEAAVAVAVFQFPTNGKVLLNY